MVRNITVTITPNTRGDHGTSSGVFTKTVYKNGWYPQGTSGDYSVFTFNANTVVTTASENRPINISAIPLIMAV